MVVPWSVTLSSFIVIAVSPEMASLSPMSSSTPGLSVEEPTPQILESCAPQAIPSPTLTTGLDCDNVECVVDK